MASLNASGDSFWAEQAAGANLDYALDWSDLTGGGADPIKTSQWIADPGATVTNTAVNGSITSFWVTSAGLDQWYTIRNVVTTMAGRSDSRTVMLFSQAASAQSMSSVLFPNKFTAIAHLRNDALPLAASGALTPSSLSDDFLWNTLQAAEATARKRLNVFFGPTEILPDDASADEVAALKATGAKVHQEAAYDYSPEFFSGERWGLIVCRQRPVIDVHSITFQYPNKGVFPIFNVPLDWIRLDRKYGHIRLVPTAGPVTLPLTSFVMQAMGGGRVIPGMVQVRYSAGINSGSEYWADLLDAVYKCATLKLIEGSFPAGSASVSVDGLSQSKSVTLGDFATMVDDKFEAVSRAIHGVRVGFFGA